MLLIAANKFWYSQLGKTAIKLNNNAQSYIYIKRNCQVLYIDHPSTSKLSPFATAAPNKVVIVNSDIKLFNKRFF